MVRVQVPPAHTVSTTEFILLFRITAVFVSFYVTFFIILDILGNGDIWGNLRCKCTDEALRYITLR